MRVKRTLALTVTLLSLVGARWLAATQTGAARGAAPVRPQGPCDIYAAAADPCVAAHSTTRALSAAYAGPLYQVLRQSDGRTLDVGVVPPGRDGGGYANAAAQDAFCAGTYCWMTTIYDQSGKHNNLTQAPRGGFSGPAMGGFNNLPLADMAPVTVLGHKVYGVFIEPGMGLRDDDPSGTAVDDQAEGQYWVINGQHYNSGCCFDYGNAETDSRDDGNGTMETTYYGDAGAWYHGPPPGPWVMTDQENNLVGCANADPSKGCPNLPNITWRFVTAMAKGEPHHWTSMGGDSQRGPLQVMFTGPRVNPTYDPMRKQGAILLGNGGDNSNGSQGTFYEGAMTAGGTFPTDATDQLIQANVVAARYDVVPLTIRPAKADAPTGLQTFAPGASQDVTLTFTNTSAAPVSGLVLGLVLPPQWKTMIGPLRVGDAPVAPGAAVVLPPGAVATKTFTVTAGPVAFNGDLQGTAQWGPTGATHAVAAVEKIRSVDPIRINEFQVGSGAPANPTNTFIELYNAGTTGTVDLSNWSLTEHAIQQAAFSSLTIPAGTKLAAGGFYLLGLSTSGLVVPAHKGDAELFVRSTTGISVGDPVMVGIRPGEAHKVATVGTAATASTTLWQPLPDGPILTIPVGSTTVPVTNVTGFAVGEKIALGYGATYPVVGRTLEKYEVATVTAVGKAGTQGRLAAEAPAGTQTLKLSSVDNISAGDTIRLDIASRGHGIETVTVTAVGTAGPTGTGVSIAEALKFDHAANMPFSDRGTGITFSPATAFAHSSNEPVQALGTGITLDGPLARDHAIDAVVFDPAATTAGYQGRPVPSQWFGGPALSPSAGSLILRDANGLVVDSLNYGGLVDPWAGSGDQSVSGANQSGCRAPAPTTGARGGGPGASGVNRSTGRFPDGASSNSNCADFVTQIATTLPVPSAAGAMSVKVTSVADFAVGQTVTLDTGADSETAVIAAVGTSGGATLTADTPAGLTILPVTGVAGLAAGATVTIDAGPNAETAVIVSSAGAGRGGRGGAPTGATVTIAAPLAKAHATGTLVAGTGITFSAPLAHRHAAGTPMATSAPTPGAPNKYVRR